jgi:hypothetical protein
MRELVLGCANERFFGFNTSREEKDGKQDDWVEEMNLLKRPVSRHQENLYGK